MPRVLIVADDLSGAADGAIACAASGLSAVVVLDDAEGVDAEALAVDADTRRMAPADAARATARIVRRHPPEAILFKKLDSTLRGNWAAEVAAALRARRAAVSGALAVLAPAFPATGRTTVGGVQLLDGVPLERTEIWRREGIVGRAAPAAMLERTGLRVAGIGLDAVRGSRERLRAAMAAGKADVAVCDAETEADLRAIAGATAALGASAVWAGSAGLARHLPGALGLVGTAPTPALIPEEGPLLFVVGSPSPVSREQVARLNARPDVKAVVVPPAALRAGVGSPAWAEQDARLTAALSHGGDTVAVLGGESRVNPAEALELCSALARLVAPHAGRVGGLVAAGGETARAVLRAFGVRGLRLVGEVEPGVPLAVAEGRRLPVITKAGAFGDPETLIRCRRVLRHPGSAAPPAGPADTAPEPEES